jgi:hypothetical protein
VQATPWHGSIGKVLNALPKSTQPGAPVRAGAVFKNGKPDRHLTRPV